MSGRKGRSGRKAMTVAEHVLRGSYRPERHGPLPENVANFPTSTTAQGQASVDGWSPTRAELRSLGRKGKTFVSQWVNAHVCSLREGVVVLAAARALDEADRWRRRSRAKGPSQARSARLTLGFEKQFTSLLSQLRVSQ